MHKLDRNGKFTKMFVVKYGFADEVPMTKKFLTANVAKEFAESVFACLQDVTVEYRQSHSVMRELFAEETC